MPNDDFFVWYKYSKNTSVDKQRPKKYIYGEMFYCSKPDTCIQICNSDKEVVVK